MKSFAQFQCQMKLLKANPSSTYLVLVFWSTIWPQAGWLLPPMSCRGGPAVQDPDSKLRKWVWLANEPPIRIIFELEVRTEQWPLEDLGMTGPGLWWEIFPSESISMSSVVLRKLPSCPPSMKRVPFGRRTLEAPDLAWSISPTWDQELPFKAKQAL